MKPIKILIVEDSEIVRQMLLKHLERAGYEVFSRCVCTAAEYRELLAADNWDLIISDYEMPDFNGREAFQILRESVFDIPFILLSGAISEEVAVQMMSAGIADYLMKNNISRLVPVIERELESLQNRRRQRETENSLKESEERYRNLFENANDAIFTIDLDGRYTSINKKVEEMLGYSREEILNASLCDHLNEEDTKRMYELRDQKAQGIDSETRYELEINTKNGGKKNIEVSSRLILKNGVPFEIEGISRDITARKQLEKNLTATEARFRTLAENNVAGVTLCEANGNLLFVNDAYLNIVGYSRKDFESGRLKWNEITAPEFREADKISLEQARQNGKSEQYEKEYICRDGSRVPVLVAIAMTKIDGEEYFISAILDFTERKKNERELRESAEDFHALVIATSQVVWTITNGKSNEEFTKFWENLTGQTYTESKGFGWLDVVHPEDRETAGRLWQDSFTNKVPFNTVYRILTVSGKYNYYAVRGVPVFDENGGFRKWVGAFSNITERKEVEEKLRQSEARLQLSQDAGRVGTWEWNFKTNELIWSDTIWSFYNLKPGEINLDYESWKNFVHPEDLAYIESEFAASLAGKGTIDLEFRILTRQNQIVWLVSKGRIIRDKDGKPERLIGINLEITERKKVEANLLASEEKLAQAQKLESIGRLAGGIAHDFNNMLTAINGYSDLILGRMPAANPLRNFVEEIRKAGARSAELTHQLLAFSRRQMLQPVALNINRVIADTTVMLQRLISEDVTLIEKFNAEIGQVEADQGQITQVIINLAVNARDAMPNGGTLTIETENVDLDAKYVRENPWVKEGNYVLLKVSDTGTGIDEETLKNIFEPFFTTKEIGGGTGLGLATVYGIVKQSGGHINVRSVVGEGTVFEIYLPETERKSAIIEKIAPPEKRLGGSETILIVEDEEIVRKLTCEILESYGYRITEAENGEDALRIAAQSDHSFDLLLTDVVMPKIGGHELAAKLLSEYPRLRILFTSGYAEDLPVKYEKMNVVSDFIHKPFTPDSLVSKIREILDVTSQLS